VQFTFPSQGFYTVKVTFADNAGNTAEATASITINKAPAGSNALPVSFSGPGNKLSAKIVGNKIRVTMKGAITPPAGAGRQRAPARSRCGSKRASGPWPTAR
jgi:hypothetical protein